MTPRAVCPRFAALLFLLLFTGATLASSSAFYTFVSSPPLPPDISMNRDAGLGNWIIIKVHMAGGDDFPVVLDTGCPTTCLDTSLEPKLGQCIETNTLWDFGVKSMAKVFLAPKLFLKDTPLMKIGPYVVTHNCKAISSGVGHPVLGIIGMDILQNYCIQLDFPERKIRFLDDDRARKGKWGAPIRLYDAGDGCVTIRGNLAGADAPGSLIDTGYNQDGWLVPKLFEQWTNQAAPLRKGAVHSPDGVLEGQIYPRLDLQGVSDELFSTGDAHIKFNGIGLRFLARHLVTMDFPEQTLYLKRVSIGPLADTQVELERKSQAKSAAKFLKSLERQGRLPGWEKTDRVAGGRLTARSIDDDMVIFDLSKKGAAVVHHYTISRASQSAHWQLHRAWVTAPNGKVVEEYSIP